MTEYNRIRRWVGGDVDLERGVILDYGCGQGIAAASFALRHPHSQVFGCDIKPVDQDWLERRLQSQLGSGLPGNLRFFQLGESLPQLPKFDLVYSWSVFEHIAVNQLQDAFRQVGQWLKPSRGRFFLQISPLYFSPRGSHLYRYFPEPWHHLLHSIEALETGVLSHSDPPERTKRAWQQFIELNRLTADTLLEHASAAGLSALRKQVRETDQEPPDRLRAIYRDSALKTQELMAYFR